MNWLFSEFGGTARDAVSVMSEIYKDPNATSSIRNACEGVHGWSVSDSCT